MKKILIIDDEKDIRFILEEIFTENNFSTVSTSTVKESEDYIKNNSFDIAFVDVMLDEKNRDGLYLLKIIKDKYRDVPVIMMSGHANIEIAVNSVKDGAFEFLEKPFNQDRLLNFAKRASEYVDLLNSKKDLQENIFKSFDFIGENKEIVKIKNSISKVSDTDVRVLIEGGSGSGKELLARELHKNSKRSKENFIILDATRINENNFEKKLFGNKDNNRNELGILEKANNGTLFIDHIDELPLNVQNKLLRIITDQRFKRSEDNQEVRINFRLICASSTSLKEDVLNGSFREDLLHRINVIYFYIPDLKDRASDVPLLAEYFYKKFKGENAVFEKVIKNYDPFFSYNWPGNIRELRNLIERIAIIGNDDVENNTKIVYEYISSQKNITIDNSINTDLTLKEARDNFEKEYLQNQLNKYDGNVSKTAEAVGMERSALHRKLTSLNIKN